jgi:hypothetical protein
MRYSRFWDFTRLFIDIYGESAGTVFKSQVLPLNMGPIACPETSVTNYQYRLRNIPEERIFNKTNFHHITKNFNAPKQISIRELNSVSDAGNILSLPSN